MKKFLLGLILALVLVSQSSAAFYSVAFSFNPATAPTDSVVITGSSTKLVELFGYQISGTATALSSATMTMVKRSTLDTGGTSSALTPVAWDSSAPAASCSVLQYTANPTLGTLVGTLFAWLQVFNSSLTGIVGLAPTFFDTASQSNPVIINGANEMVAINFGGSKPLGTVLTGWLIFSEL